MTSPWLDLLDLAELLRFRTKDRSGFSRSAAEQWLNRTNDWLKTHGKPEIETRRRGRGGSTVLVRRADLERADVLELRTGGVHVASR